MPSPALFPSHMPIHISAGRNCWQNQCRRGLPRLHPVFSQAECVCIRHFCLAEAQQWYLGNSQLSQAARPQSWEVVKAIVRALSYHTNETKPTKQKKLASDWVIPGQTEIRNSKGRLYWLVSASGSAKGCFDLLLKFKILLFKIHLFKIHWFTFLI